MPDQARAVCDGLPGDIVALALPLDVDKIREAGLIREGWQQRLPNNAIVAESVVAIVTRPGNPKNITGWDDLIRCPLLHLSVCHVCCPCHKHLRAWCPRSLH